MSLIYSNNSVALGTGDYNNMKHKPAIGGVELTENTTLEQLGLGAAFKYKGQVATESALPTSGMTTGDTYNVADTGENYTWNGSSWDKLTGDLYLTTAQGAENSGKTLKVDANGNVTPEKVITTIIKEW